MISKKEIFRVSFVSVIVATISMWIMWACTYMHQMYPIIQPKMTYNFADLLDEND